jgi:alkylhydroperoxidase family enzyme
MLEFAEKMTLTPDACSEQDIEHLRETGFADEDIYDIVMLAAYRSFITRVADALGVQLKGERLADPRIVHALSTGKPAASIS